MGPDLHLWPLSFKMNQERKGEVRKQAMMEEDMITTLLDQTEEILRTGLRDFMGQAIKKGFTVKPISYGKMT